MKAVARETDVAIIGMAGLFAKAPDIVTFWSNILAKTDAVTEAPAEWQMERRIHSGEITDIAQIYTSRGGFLGDLSRFDPRPYGTMPISVSGGEPDQFLALHCAAEALRDAGYPAGSAAGATTGIILGHTIHANRGNVNGIEQGLLLDQIVGIFRSAYPEAPAENFDRLRSLLKSKLPAINVDAMPGLVPNMLTGRIANRLDLMGPNYIIDAACASSLISVDLAISELASGRADLMLAGGVNTTTSPLVYMVFCQLGALSRSSTIRPFSTIADGTLLGEGQGILVLKRLADAIRDDDRIYAVVKASGQSSDGRATGLLAPRLEGEILAMRRAYENSGIDPATIGLIEAHGTGIPLGDRTEIAAIHEIFGPRQKSFPSIAIGSVKSMIGHCIPAAGSASIIKMALSLHTKTLPPTLAEELNPEVGMERTPLYLNTEATPWVHCGPHPRRAAINAFGFGGINSHMVLEEAPGSSSGVDPTVAFMLRATARSEIVVAAAGDRPSLMEAIEAIGKLVDSGKPLAAIAAEAFEARGSGPQRLAIVAHSTSDLGKKLAQARNSLRDADVHRWQTQGGVFFADAPLSGKVAFVFPGENSQYPGMLRDLALSFPEARSWLDFLDGLFSEDREAPHRTLLYPPPTAIGASERALLQERLMDVDAGSEAVFCADQAVFSVLRDALGLEPDFLLGHSTGENAALVASEIFRLDRGTVRRYIRAMNAAFRRLQADPRVPRGALLSVGAIDRRQLLDLVESRPGVYFTMDNCPNQAVLYAPNDLADAVVADLTGRGAVCQRLEQSWPYHTPLLKPMADAFAEIFAEIEPTTPIAPVYSCVRAEPFGSEPADVRKLALDQYVQRVRFTESIHALYEAGARFFIEAGPSSNLTAFIRDILKGDPHLAVACDNRRVNGLTQLQRVAGQLFVHDLPVRLERFYVRAADRPAPQGPYLTSALPYIRLDPADANELRSLLAGPSTTSSRRPPVRISEPQAAGSASPRPPMRGEFGIPVQNWSKHFVLPAPAEVSFVRLPAELGLPDVERALAIAAGSALAERERAVWLGEIASRPLTRRVEWLLARIAAKSAAAEFAKRLLGQSLAARDIEIGRAESGQPLLRVGASMPPPHVSISHSQGLAAACVASAAIGIDLEHLDRLRSPEDVARIAFEPTMWRRVNERFPDKAGQCAAILWSMKEAAAKCLGEGLVGREREFAFVRLANDLGSATIARGAVLLDVAAKRFGPLVCSVALRQSSAKPARMAGVAASHEAAPLSPR
jgi:acyl transferase domain-containing protein/phosphopantetheinyl transferase (holo-ACP synthase)